jgi:hypothetical protein|nr:MAG: hypothetical protein [Bacteriophage sp.]
MDAPPVAQVGDGAAMAYRADEQGGHVLARSFWSRGHVLLVQLGDGAAYPLPCAHAVGQHVPRGFRAELHQHARARQCDGLAGQVASPVDQVEREHRRIGLAHGFVGSPRDREIIQRGDVLPMVVDRLPPVAGVQVHEWLLCHQRRTPS